MEELKWNLINNNNNNNNDDNNNINNNNNNNNNKICIYLHYLKKEMSDKHERLLQLYTMIFVGDGQDFSELLK